MECSITGKISFLEMHKYVKQNDQVHILLYCTDAMFKKTRDLVGSFRTEILDM